MRLVILESPYAGRTATDREANVVYARLCLRDSISRGEAPIASHLLYTQEGVLDDDNQFERNLGIAAGLAWRKVSEAHIVYIDRGVSSGMEHGIITARRDRKPIEIRSLYGNPLTCKASERARHLMRSSL